MAACRRRKVEEELEITFLMILVFPVSKGLHFLYDFMARQRKVTELKLSVERVKTPTKHITSEKHPVFTALFVYTIYHKLLDRKHYMLILSQLGFHPFS